MSDQRDARIERLLDAYFDTRVGDLVRRVVATATPEEISDDEAMGALRDRFLDRLRARYVHADAGWNHEAELLVHVEWDHAVERERSFAAAFEDLE